MSNAKNIPIEYLAMSALNPFAQHDSSSRAVMFNSHFTQRLVIDGADEKIIQTGIEREFSKYTFSVQMPEDGKIIKVIDRYPRGIGKDSMEFNPETIVIYENDQTKEIDYFSIPYYCSYHQFFGFKYEQKNPINDIRPGAYISKGTIFADSSSVGDNGAFKYGINMNVAFMSIPSVSEDGIMISRDALDKLKFKLYETRVVEFGSDSFPLNLFGTKDNYKPFKDIGEYLDDNGLLMMMRAYDDDLAPVDTSVYDTMEPDFIFDKGVYVRGGRGKIVDIKVIGNNSKIKQLPEQINEHISKYERALLKFHQEIVDTEEKIRYERKRKYGTVGLNISPKLHRLIVESLAILDYNAAKLKQSLNLLYRKNPIDEYRIEFVVEYEMTPGIGYKMTGGHGDKGVIVAIKDAMDMPVDADGNRADIITDPGANINRMNLGRLYETYIASAARDVAKEVRRLLGITQLPIGELALFDYPKVNVDNAYNFLLGFYKIVSDVQYEFFNSLITEEEKIEHLTSIVNDKIYLYMPADNPKDNVKMVTEIEAYHKPTYGPVSYVGDSGERRVTKDNVRIAPMYMMLLEKIADDWSSVSSGKLQHFGVLAPTTKSEKFAYPYRNTPVRTIGETEGRIFASYCGPEAIAEMLDRSNSPTTQRNAIWNILHAEKPTNIDNVINRDYIKLGSSKPLSLVRHVMGTSGLLPVYEKETKPDLSNQITRAANLTVMNDRRASTIIINERRAKPTKTE